MLGGVVNAFFFRLSPEAQGQIMGKLAEVDLFTINNKPVERRQRGIPAFARVRAWIYFEMSVAVVVVQERLPAGHHPARA